MQNSTHTATMEPSRWGYFVNTNPNLWIMVFFDAILVLVSITLAFLIRFEGLPSNFFHDISTVAPYLVLLRISCFYMFGLYRGMWRYTSAIDLIGVLKASVFSTAVILTCLFIFNCFEGLSRTVFILDGILVFLLITGHRVFIRFLFQYGTNPRQILRNMVSPDVSRKKRLLLIGAGNTAEKILREVRENKKLPYVVVGMVDDDIKKQGLRIHGIPVMGPLDSLRKAVVVAGAQELLIATPLATGKQLQRIVQCCKETSLPYKILPALQELIHGQVSLSTMREVSYTDLLGRPAVYLEQDEIGKYLTGKTILVTGAGGSIGSELCRQIIKFEPKKLILFDAGEENLYTIQMELRHEHDFTASVAVLGKIQNRNLLDDIFIAHRPTVVFHAAAYKHVPLVERNPWEAIFNNVFAVRSVIEASITFEVDRFVLVSTDKAVRPTNVMGASKRLTELLMLAYSQSNWDQALCRDRKTELKKACKDTSSENRKVHTTTFMAVRFGNVLGSSGSVVPLFKRQIKQGGPITVTHPEITRYFMSIEEAAQLILQSGAMSKGGEIFILKMGAPIKIVKMARDLIKMYGKKPDTEIKIEFTGLRPGEKLYEELITEGEGIVSTDHEKIMVLRGDGMPYSQLKESLSRLAQTAKAHDHRGIKEILNEIMPEYEPDLQVDSVTQQR